VTFDVAPGSGSVVGPVQTTHSDGIARVVSWTLGSSPGPNTLTATSEVSLVGSPVTFHATAVTGVTVEVRNDYFRSMRNGSGSPGDEGANLFGHAAVDTIGRGEAVTWVWVGQNHNVTGSPFDPSLTQNAPNTFSVTFTSPGTYVYRCTNHSSTLQYLGLVGMRGQIVVR
jgi:plastocyanin